MEYIGLAFLIWCLFTNYQERLQALADIGKAWRGEKVEYGNKEAGK